MDQSLQQSLYKMTNLAALILILLCAMVTPATPDDGKVIANQFGDDLSFASKQLIRGFTSIFGPLLDTARGGDHPNSLRHVLVRDGVNALGKGVKASATVLSTPARVIGTGIEEAKKVAGAVPGVKSEAGKVGVEGEGAAQSDGAKVASTLLNTTASQFSQANLGAILVEVALKNRIKDEANKTRSRIEQSEAANTAEETCVDPEAPKEEPASSTPSAVDTFLEKFNEAIQRNDGRLRDSLQEVLKQINPPKND